MRAAVTVWGYLVEQTLRMSRRLSPSHPGSLAEACAAVESQAIAIRSSVERLLEGSFVASVRQLLLAELGRLGITAKIAREERRDPFPHRLMSYYRSENISVQPEAEEVEASSQTGSTSVDSYLRSHPDVEAARQVVGAINRAAGRWIRLGG